MRTLPAAAVGAVLALAALAGCSHHAGGPAAAPSSAGAVPPAASAPAAGSPSAAGSPAAPAAPVPRSGTGIAGTTMLVGGCPVPMEKPCPARPVSTMLSILDVHTDATVTTVTSGKDGRFRVDLAPGRYLVRPARPTGPLMSRIAPVTADVHEGAYTTVTLTFQANIE